MALPLRMAMDLCRKRRRNPNEEESSEFTPLSKRINNLHLNTFPLSKPLVECEPKAEAHKELVAANERLSSLQYDISRGVDDSPGPQAGGEWPPQYSPDLSSSENPFYYEPNRLLYELYQQRIQRQPAPHF